MLRLIRVFSWLIYTYHYLRFLMMQLNSNEGSGANLGVKSIKVLVCSFSLKLETSRQNEVVKTDIKMTLLIETHLGGSYSFHHIAYFFIYIFFYHDHSIFQGNICSCNHLLAHV